MIISERKAKINWHCRRGMLELDLMLNRFMTQYFDQLDPVQVDQFEWLLEYSDPELYSCLTGQSSPDHQELANLVDTIRFHLKSESL